MSTELYTADKKVLVEIVKLAQKRGLKGAKGEWKEFLTFHDRKFGSSLSDPAKRSKDVVKAFLETFTREEDLEFFSKVMRRHENLKAMERPVRDSPDCESPQQKLVRLTVGHPQYVQYYTFPSHNEDWMVIPLGEVSKLASTNSMIAVDCEMVLCQDGTEAVVQVCAVDHNLEVKLNEIVRPNKPISDFRTDITGICSQDLKGVTCSLVDVQKSLRNLLSHGTILVGHGLHNDLQGLIQAVLGTEVRKDGDPHNCLADAEAAMKLVLAKIEHGFDDPIVIERKKVSEADLAKLLLHRIPVDVPSQDLLKLFPNYPNINIQPEFRISGHTYSMYVAFEDCKEALEVFEEIEGQEEKDCCGRPQKLVSLRLNENKTIAFYVRKMVSDAPYGVSINLKRTAKRRRNI